MHVSGKQEQGDTLLCEGLVKAKWKTPDKNYIKEPEIGSDRDWFAATRETQCCSVCDEFLRCKMKILQNYYMQKVVVRRNFYYLCEEIYDKLHCKSAIRR